MFGTVALVGAVADLREIAGRVAPVSLAADQVLPVAPVLAESGLLPPHGVRRGSVVVVAGSTSLALALAAGPSAAGSWCAAVGMPALGLVAAAEAGIALERFALVPAVPADQWATVVAALVDTVDVVLVAPPPRMRAADGRRLAARARERGAVLVSVNGWSDAPDLRLTVDGVRWSGIGDGHGHLRERRLRVVVDGRRALARPKRGEISW
jgi:hypothetical protein